MLKAFTVFDNTDKPEIANLVERESIKITLFWKIILLFIQVCFADCPSLLYSLFSSHFRKY